jgi:hypothetical protein
MSTEYVPLRLTQTYIKMVQKCVLIAVFGQTVLVFKYTNVDFLLDFSQNSVLMDIHVNEIDVAFVDIIAGAFRFVWR